MFFILVSCRGENKNSELELTEKQISKLNFEEAVEKLSDFKEFPKNIKTIKNKKDIEEMNEFIVERVQVGKYLIPKVFDKDTKEPLNLIVYFEEDKGNFYNYIKDGVDYKSINIIKEDNNDIWGRIKRDPYNFYGDSIEILIEPDMRIASIREKIWDNKERNIISENFLDKIDTDYIKFIKKITKSKETDSTIKTEYYAFDKKTGKFLHSYVRMHEPKTKKEEKQ